MTAAGPKLTLVATPIGNLGDLSPRAVDTLANADVIACEDTRRTGKLLAHAGVEAPKLVVVNDHTEESGARQIVTMLEDGLSVCLVTDAGMPAISDPGARVVRAVVDAGFEVSVVPGPTAVSAALAVSGLTTGRFVFEGFLPRSGGARQQRLAAAAAEPRTVVVYESPHRIVRTVDELAAVCGDERRVTIARELTKLHEEIFRGTLGEAQFWLSEREPRGEYVVVVAGCPDTRPDALAIEAAVAAAIDEGATARDAARQVSDSLKVSKNAAYEVAITLAGAGRDAPPPRTP